MKKTLLLFGLLLFTAQTTYTQEVFNFWRDIDESQIVLPARSELEVIASEYRTLTLDLTNLKGVLRQAPEEFSTATPLIVALPMPDGTMEPFSVVASPVMMPELAERYPMIQSYKAHGIRDRRATARFDYSPNGFHASIRSSQGDIIIEPYGSQQEQYHYSFFKRHTEIAEALLPPQMCGTEDIVAATGLAEDHSFPSPEELLVSHSRNSATQDVRVYTLALACTGEYGATHGGTVETVLASMNTAVNRMNEIFEQEVGIRIMLIGNNDDLIYLDGSTDPFVNANSGRLLLAEIENYLVANVGVNNYDLGHIFTNSCTDVGGVVGGEACQGGKSQGVTCHYLSSVIAMVDAVMSHEVGHQFTARHTWANCPPTIANSPGQLHTESAMEPGSGSTIMSYAGLCGSQNVLPTNDTYYHVKSLEQFIEHTRMGGAAGCATLEPTNNTIPEVTTDYVNGFYIPISTPFELTAAATDPDDDILTYCWEEYDTGPIAPMGEPVGRTPLFRSFPPDVPPTRVFPRLPNIINNQMDVRETLPTYSRGLSFVCTVRDNSPLGNAVDWTRVNFLATASAGPFLVSVPNSGEEDWMSGSYYDIIWDVANTDNELVNCQAVNIRLSTDGGFTYPLLLAEAVPNTGTARIPLPDLDTDKARVRVEAANNIFFDISNQNFAVRAATAPGYTLRVDSPQLVKTCLPDNVDFALSTFAFLDFANPITLEVVDGLPPGAIASFSSATIAPTESSTLSIDLAENGLVGRFEILVRAVAEAADTIYQTVYLDLVSNDYTDLTLGTPVDGTSGIVLSAPFDWSDAVNAATYDFELSTSPAFGDSIVDVATGLVVSEYLPEILLAPNELYYWRIRPINECGVGPYSEPFTFHTVNISCIDVQATDVPVTISGSGLPTVQSKLNVPISGTISDLNIPLINGRYQSVNNIRITLTSPAGTQAVLFDQNCGNTQDFNIGFDDEAPSPIICPPDDNIVFQPVDSLAVFQGEDSQGEWTLEIKVVTPGFGGGGLIDQWSLEFCGALTPSNPFLVTNDTLGVRPGEANTLTKSKLEVQDDNNGPAELTYTLVTAPEHGDLFFQGVPLVAGDQFRQASINSANVSYAHSGDDAEFDDFTFVVEDPEGGWLPTQRFHIKIDENAVVGTNEPPVFRSLLLFPNPNHGQFQLDFGQPLTEQVNAGFYNAHGQLVLQLTLSNEQRFQIEVQDLPSGIYLLQFRTTTGVASRKVVIHR